MLDMTRWWTIIYRSASYSFYANSVISAPARARSKKDFTRQTDCNYGQPSNFSKFISVATLHLTLRRHLFVSTPLFCNNSCCHLQVKRLWWKSEIWYNPSSNKTNENKMWYSAVKQLLLRCKINLLLYVIQQTTNYVVQQFLTTLMTSG